MVAELAEVPNVRVLWSRVLGVISGLVKLPEDSLRADILKDNIQDAKHGLLVGLV